MTFDRRDSPSRLTIVSYPAEIVASLLPELNGALDQLNRMPVIQSNSNPENSRWALRLDRFEQSDEAAR
jgi:hypothetical protein